MTTYDSWYPFVLPWVPECADAVALHHIRQAVIKFCEDTGVWRQTLPTVMSEAGSLTFTVAPDAAISGTLTAAFTGATGTYTIEFDDGTDRAVTLTNGSAAVSWTGPVSADADVNYFAPTYPIPLPANSALARILRFEQSSITGEIVTVDYGSKMLLNQRDADAVWTEDKLNFGVNPAPCDNTTRYDLTVSLKPAQASTGVPDIVFEQYADTISNGALATLLKLPKQAWTNVGEASDKAALFKDACDATAAALGKGYGRARGRSKAHLF